MKIRKLLEKDITSAKRLWKQAFGDSDLYIDFNFKTNITLDNSLAIFEADKLVCMLFMIPKILMLDGKETSTYFIAGVSTDNDFRHKGYAKKLMNQSHDNLKSQGIPFVFLYPFNHDFYRKLGYETVNMMKKVKLELSMSPRNNIKKFKVDICDICDDALLKRVISVYDVYANRFDGYFRRSKNDFEKTINTLCVEGGHVMIINDGNKDVGWAFYYIDNGKVECQQSMFLDEHAVRGAQQHFAENARYRHDGFIYCDKEYEIDDADVIEYAMVKKLDDKSDTFNGKKILILEQY